MRRPSAGRRAGVRLAPRKGGLPLAQRVRQAILAAGASYAWSAEDAVSGGGLTTSWPGFIGGVTLAPVATTQNEKVAVASLGGRLAVPFAASGAYGGTIVAPGLSQTLITVSNVAATLAGVFSLTSGAANTGTSILNTGGGGAGNLSARRLSGDTASGGFSYPYAKISIAVLTAADANHYVNSNTPFTAVGAAAGFSQAQATIGALDTTAATFPLSGHVALAAVIPAALTAPQVAALFAVLGPYYGQVIA